MRRRSFIAGVGAMTALSRVARAQPVALPSIGLLFPAGNRTPRNSIVRGLAERGYVEGRTIRLEERDAEGRLERLPELARELVALRVNVIIAFAASATVAARQATATIPIVMVHAGDPIGSGLIASLSHPGGNVTGTTSYSSEIVAKGIEFLRELVPSSKRLAILVVPSNAGAPLAIRQAEAAAASLHLDLTVVGVERVEDFETAFATIERNADALYVFAEPLLAANQSRLIEFAARARLPTMYLIGEIARAGGLIGYSPVFSVHYPRVADYVDKILKGASPADLPVEQSTRFELVINLNTAKALGLTVPQSLLARADEVIE
jgi:putative ABC transport system substrate-binding protein